MDEQDRKFLQSIADYCALQPSVAPFVAQAAADGAARAFQQVQERAADLEAVLVAMATKPNSPWARDILRQRLVKWTGKLTLNWEHFLKDEK
jgi:hypothetical protein